MKRPNKAVVTKKRDSHSYSSLWHASGCVLRSGTQESKGSSWQFLSSLILTAFTFEAYLNHIIDRDIKSSSDIDKLNKLSPLDKFDCLCDSLSVTTSFDRGSRPLQTIVKLFRFRNAVAHSHSEILDEEMERNINDNLDQFIGKIVASDWEILIHDKDFAQMSRDDVEGVLRILHNSRKNKEEILFGSGISTACAKIVPHS